MTLLEQENAAQDIQVSRVNTSTELNLSSENKKVDATPVSIPTPDDSLLKADSNRRMISATDLFQSKRG